MKIKIFLNGNIGDAERKVNEFIDEHKIEVADIKITMSRVQVIIVLVYSIKQKEDTK